MMLTEEEADLPRRDWIRGYTEALSDVADGLQDVKGAYLMERKDLLNQVRDIVLDLLFKVEGKNDRLVEEARRARATDSEA